MSTKAYYKHEEIGPNKVGFPKASSPVTNTRAIIEAAFYGNNVVEIKTVKEAYELAKRSPGTVVTDMPVYKPETTGLPKDAKILLFNDGSITGRYAAARRITGKEGTNCAALDKILMDAVYDTRWKKMYHAETVIGLDPEFMCKAHLLIPEGEENLLYNWMINFQYMNAEYTKMYGKSQPVGNGNEPDIYIFSDPQWKGSTQTDVCDGKCVCYFNTETNCAAILGMKYFGEHKKGTLTLGWAIANRNGYASCHGGQKEITRQDGSKYVAAFFGLSGSGKSTLTHNKHNNRYPAIKILHDDAFIINTDTCSSIAMEPTYFDKTADYPVGSPDNKFLLTAQNCSCTRDADGKVVLVTEDIRNGNGRAIKSKIWSPNRVDKIVSPVNSIFWIMKDPTLPPILRIKGDSLASVMGATLATKRSTAERLAPGVDPNALVVEPYANPFRTYPLVNDYEKFKKLIGEKKVDCYIINTGDFYGKKVKKEDTLGVIEAVVDGRAKFQKWGPFSDIEICEWAGFVPDLKDKEYLKQLKARMNDRLDYVKSLDKKEGGFNKLPKDAVDAIAKVVKEIESLK